MKIQLEETKQPDGIDHLILGDVIGEVGRSFLVIKIYRDSRPQLGLLNLRTFGVETTFDTVEELKRFIIANHYTVSWESKVIVKY